MLEAFDADSLLRLRVTLPVGWISGLHTHLSHFYVRLEHFGLRVGRRLLWFIASTIRTEAFAGVEHVLSLKNLNLINM